MGARKKKTSGPPMGDDHPRIDGEIWASEQEMDALQDKLGELQKAHSYLVVRKANEKLGTSYAYEELEPSWNICRGGSPSATCIYKGISRTARCLFCQLRNGETTFQITSPVPRLPDD